MSDVVTARVERLIDTWAEDRPDRPALLCRDRRWTYAALKREMDRRAALLVAAGLNPGDVVVTAELVTDDVGLSFLACCRADCTFLYLSDKLATTELAWMMQRAGARLVLTADGEPHPAAPMVPAAPLALPGTPDSGALVEAMRRSAAGSAEAVVILQSTSGTTGTLPKLGRQTHRMLTWQQMSPAVRRSYWELEAIYFRPRANYFSVRDFCEALTSGGRMILSDTRRPEEIEGEMAVRGAAILGAVPAMVQLLVDRDDPPPPGLALRYVRTGAALLPERIVRKAADRYGATIFQEYGSTEGGSMIGTPREGAPPGSIGKPYPGVAARIVNEAGTDVAVGDVGELLVRTPGMMLGYLGDDAATARAIRDGWIWTGDLARRDSGGFYYLEGRQTLRINVGGFKVIPERVEDVLESHPGVREAAVTAMPDARRGEAVRAIIVPRDAPPAIGDLRRFCRERLADYEVPQAFEFRDALPRSALGKVLRAQL